MDRYACVRRESFDSRSVTAENPRALTAALTSVSSLCCVGLCISACLFEWVVSLEELWSLSQTAMTMNRPLDHLRRLTLICFQEKKYTLPSSCSLICPVSWVSWPQRHCRWLKIDVVDNYDYRLYRLRYKFAMVMLVMWHPVFYLYPINNLNTSLKCNS